MQSARSIILRQRRFCKRPKRVKRFNLIDQTWLLGLLIWISRQSRGRKCFPRIQPRPIASSVNANVELTSRPLDFRDISSEELESLKSSESLDEIR